MAGHGYSVFDTSVGRCGIAWGQGGILGVHLPEAREIETRRRLLRQFPDAREQAPPADIAAAIAGITAALRGLPSDLSNAPLDTDGIAPFNRRVYQALRLIPRGQTRLYADIATRLGASGAVYSVGHAIARNPFAIIVPCHRALESVGKTSGFAGNGGIVTKHRLLSLDGALSGGPTLIDMLFPAAPSRASP